MNVQILIIDDEVNMLDMLSVSLRKEGYSVITSSTGEQGIELAATSKIDLILCDVKMPGMDGLKVLEQLSLRNVHSPVIMMSAFATVATAVDAMKKGAYDFITKPFQIAEVLCILEKALDYDKLKKENFVLRTKLNELGQGCGFDNLIGESGQLKDILTLARKVARHETTVLITGESGTGKELLARGIHNTSERSKGPFITVNCGAIPANLLESEFFGYVKGAFTGADSDREGLFESASGGTLLLDEVGDLPAELQVKLLRVLQEREVRPLGASENRKINVRLLAATAKDLTQAVANGEFRQDLLFRINVVELTMPPLRSRVGDIPRLVSFLLKKASADLGIEIDGVTSDALESLSEYSWPGNVREMKNIIERAVIFAENGLVTNQTLPDHIGGGLKSRTENRIPDIFSIKEGKDFLEKYLILKALRKTKCNKSKASILLEISYPSLLSKIKEYGINIKDL